MIQGSRVLGVGTDIVDVRRIQSILTKYSTHFTNKIFTKNEQEYAQKHTCPALTYAKRFAGKEAFSKAVGQGIGAFLSWQDIEILNNSRGQPFFQFTKRGHAAVTGHFGPFNSFLSLSDDYPYALAFAVIVSN